MIKLRKLNSQDSKKAEEFFSSLSNKSNYYFNRTGQNKKQIKRYINNETKSILPIVAETEERIAGMLILYNLESRIIRLSIGVSDEFQGRGIGTLLMARAKKYALKNKKGGILLTTHFSNKKAQSLYKKSGYLLKGIEGNEYVYILPL